MAVGQADTRIQTLYCGMGTVEGITPGTPGQLEAAIATIPQGAGLVREVDRVVQGVHIGDCQRAGGRQGADPSADKKANNATLTFTAFFEDDYLPFAKQRKRTWKRDQELFNRRLKKTFGNKTLNQITRSQIQTFHTGLRNEGLAGASCDHFVKILRRALNLSVEWGMLDSSPATGFRLFNEDNAIEHYLSD